MLLQWYLQTESYFRLLASHFATICPKIPFFGHFWLFFYHFCLPMSRNALPIEPMEPWLRASRLGGPRTPRKKNWKKKKNGERKKMKKKNNKLNHHKSHAFKWTNFQTYKLFNWQTFQLTNFSIKKLFNWQTFELTNYQIDEFSNWKIFKPTDFQSNQLSNWPIFNWPISKWPIFKITTF